MRAAIKKLKYYLSIFSSIDNRLDKIQQSLGRIESAQQPESNKDLQEYEFRVYSQWGEDGIIQHLIKTIPDLEKTFIEFGVQNYVESNTRFLLVNNNWAGLIIDGSQKNIDFVKSDAIYWQHNLKAECAFITRENINTIIKNSGLNGDIGLLSVDIDGNDYWIWEAIDVVTPAIVVIEYNARFGDQLAVSIPYEPNFTRSSAHHSNIYYGTSLSALFKLGAKKGYTLVGCNSAGNNAFFLRNDLITDQIKAKTVAEAFVSNQFRESRDENGEMNFISPEQERAILESLPLKHFD
ncbi:hypothetical protein [Methylophilus sp. Leaf414]|uniref:hypothetical protein n=1 Tax=Methylophilus sp. Leaf414 TaxID=1736371 RepID=UPI0006F37DD0|nr:hypothetical protein [Methylophilus sp. Leaf414]KQT34347.1 NADH dehydrogenase [Methylophilus sp. Leaf414]